MERRAPISYAAEKGNLDTIILLYNNRADINATDQYGRSPLSYAASNGHIDIVNFLVERRAIVTLNDIKFAQKNGHKSIVDVLSDVPGKTS